MAGWTIAGIDPEGWLFRAEKVIHLNPDGSPPCLESVPRIDLRVEVDPGTAQAVLLALDGADDPLAGEYHFAKVMDEQMTLKHVPGIRGCMIVDLGGGV